MLAVYLFVAFWAILALVLLFLAGRGGFGAPSRPGRRPTPTSRRATAAIFAIIYVGFGVVIPAVFLVGNHNRANAQVGGLTLTSAEKILGGAVKSARETAKAATDLAHTAQAGLAGERAQASA